MIITVMDNLNTLMMKMIMQILNNSTVSQVFPMIIMMMITLMMVMMTKIMTKMVILMIPMNLKLVFW